MFSKSYIKIKNDEACFPHMVTLEFTETLVEGKKCFCGTINLFLDEKLEKSRVLTLQTAVVKYSLEDTIHQMLYSIHDLYTFRLLYPIAAVFYMKPDSDEFEIGSYDMRNMIMLVDKEFNNSMEKT